MDFTLPVKITKELILSKYSEEQIMEYYLHIPVKKGLVRSPLREDKNPTCSFFRGKSNTLYFKDFGTGQCFSIFDLVKYKYSCSYYEALKIIANDFNIVRNNNIQRNQGIINENPIIIQDKEMTKIQIEKQEFTDYELRWWKKYGITPEILNKYEVYSCKNIFLNDQLLASSQKNCPIFGYYGSKYKDLELWRIYFPKRKSYRFISNWSKNRIQGYKQLPKYGKILVITKSLKDVMTLYSCKINAIAPNSETLFIKDSTLDNLRLRFDNIIVFYDNDRTGLQNMAKIRHKYPELIYIYIPKEYNSKDISDFYKDHGRRETLKLIKSFLLWLKENRQIQV